jgi:uncharacterized protein (DUF1697 family)
MTRYVAFLRAVNLGKRRVAMPTAREALERLGYDDVGSFVNSGNLLFTSAEEAVDCERAIRAELEDVFGFEITTFVRTAAEVRALATDTPFGELAAGHTHFVLLPLNRLSAADRKNVEAMSNDRDQCVVVGRDVHWLIRAKSTETTLGSKRWRDALPDNPTTARNTTMMAKLLDKL